MPDLDNVSDVFISYAPEDLDFVKQLHTALDNKGISAWFNQQETEAGSHWRAEIAEGIRGCTVFILVLSPDSAKSDAVRKEVALAENHNKSIMPLMWRQTETPVAFELALAGLQKLDFKQNASTENFNTLAEVLIRTLGGIALNEATQEVGMAVDTGIPALPKEDTTETESNTRRGSSTRRSGSTRRGGSSRRGSSSRSRSVQKQIPIIIQGKVISNVITHADFDSDYQDELNEEIKWLFRAVDHMYKIARDEASVDDFIPVIVPETALINDNDAVLNDNEEAAISELYRDTRVVGAAVKDLDKHLTNIKKHLTQLDMLITEGIGLGEEANRDVKYQTTLRTERIGISEKLDQVSAIIDTHFGIKVEIGGKLLDHFTNKD